MSALALATGVSPRGEGKGDGCGDMRDRRPLPSARATHANPLQEEHDMTELKRLALLCALVTSAVAAFATSAHASRGFSVSPAGTMTSSGTVTFTGSGVNIICTMSMTETVSRSINKTIGATVSSVTAASLSRCNLGVTAVFLLPWTATYSSFTGTLPNITELNGEVANGGMQLNIPGIGNCLYARGFRWKWLVILGFIAIRRVTWLWTLLEGPVLCPPLNAGGGDLTPTQRHSLTLI